MTWFPAVIVAYLFCESVFPFDWTPHQYAACVNDYHDCAKIKGGWACIEEMERKQCERGIKN